METTITEQKTQAKDPMSISFSDNAIAALKEIRSKENIPAEQKLRVGVKGGGCSGMSYVLAFDEVGEHDDHFMLNGIEMIMDRRHSLYLTDIYIDFQDGLNTRGFTFSNPNAKSTCGCGTSFST